MKFLIAVLILCINISAFAQNIPPEFINYTSVIRGNNGQALPNKDISFRFSVRELNSTGNISYQEVQNVTTSQFGSVSMKIGAGTTIVNQFKDINWGLGNHYLQIELDDDGGADFSDMGTVMLVSVPYALFSKNSLVSDSTLSYKEEDLIFKSSLASGIIDADTIRWNNKLDSETDPLFSSQFGIGLGYPAEKIFVSDGDLQVNKLLRIEDYDANSHINTYEQDYGTPVIYTRYFYGRYGDLIIQGQSKEARSNIQFVTGSTFPEDDSPTQRMIISRNGNVGIGDFWDGGVNNALPKSKLQVKSGDVYLDTIGKGVILTSPNGSCWLTTVDDTGQLQTTSIACPN